MRLSPALAMVTAAVLAVPGSATAAGLSPSSKKVVGATAAVSSCGSLSGVTLSWSVVDGVVSTVTLSAIPATCAGASLSLTLAGAGNAALVSLAPVTVSGTSQTFSSVPGSVDATTVTGAFLSVVGP
jgi:hypothetical protein